MRRFQEKCASFLPRRSELSKIWTFCPKFGQIDIPARCAVRTLLVAAGRDNAPARDELKPGDYLAQTVLCLL
jgi:hypothetical protein